ncbi:NAD(P)/FAD-dependent oxidoreductase [Bacillus sp. YZJH907-2]|uniref:NAD(P)/FAD-dependent oxidoreductase n=1 Tax=Halalkalibacter suaedae TaxID=2822140 RepID=A0A941AMX8_9BACI|nr:NAD(P)/FAD-dependent oxidoreductase [Bacillus suaedae]
MRGEIHLDCDVLIVGGGPSGLSAALVLGRAKRSVIVIDEGRPRNAVTRQSHGFLTRDNIKPMELRQIAREQLQTYPVNILDDTVVEIETRQDWFVIHSKKNKIHAKKVIFASGLKEHLPEIEGLQEAYGVSVFSCPYCDGWEHRDQPLAIIGNGENLFTYCKLISNWSEDLIVLSDGPTILSIEEQQQLKDRNITLIEEPIKELKSIDGRLTEITFEENDSIQRTAAFLLNTYATQFTTLPEKLGVELNEKGGYQTKRHGRTSTDGLYIIGDAAKRFTGLIGAASEGYETGIAVNLDLINEEWDEKS